MRDPYDFPEPGSAASASEQEEPQESGSQSGGIVPLYLAAHGAPNVAIPTVAELGLGGAESTAFACFDTRTRVLICMDGPLSSISGRGHIDRWREIAGIWGSLGESIGLSVGARVEVEFLRRAIAVGDLPREMILGQRFFSESLGQLILGSGHRLANLVVRMLSESPENLYGINDDPRLGAALTPFAEDRRAWLSAREVVTRLSKKAATHHTAVAVIVDTLIALIDSQDWITLDEQRGVYFHRLRPESEVLAGVDKDSGYTRRTLGADGIAICWDSVADFVPYTAADGLHELVDATTTAAAEQLCSTVDQINEAFYIAIEPLSGGRYSSSSGRNITQHLIGPAWDPANCACCCEALDSEHHRR